MGAIVSVVAKPLADELGVDEPLADVDVGEQPPVAVAAFGVEDQAHGLAGDQTRVLPTRLGAEALDRLARRHRFGRVDADVANVLDLAAGANLDRVAVDDVDDRTGDLVAQVVADGLVTAVLAGADQDDDQDRQQRQRSEARQPSYGVRRTFESMISLICSMISLASLHSRCQTLRP